MERQQILPFGEAMWDCSATDCGEMEDHDAKNDASPDFSKLRDFGLIARWMQRKGHKSWFNIL